MTREDIKKLKDEATKGPWSWVVNKRSKIVELEGKGGDHTVLSFLRWGVNRAAPVFWFWKGNSSDEPKRADALVVPIKGREHHKDWFMTIDHPDARLIAAAPALAQFALDTIEEVDLLLQALKDAAEALGKFVETDTKTRKPYEHPLSAYDRAKEAIEKVRK